MGVVVTYCVIVTSILSPHYNSAESSKNKAVFFFVCYCYLFVFLVLVCPMQYLGHVI